MRLSHLTITGADDSVDPVELARISSLTPLIEWGLLVDGGGDGRSAALSIDRLAPRVSTAPRRRCAERRMSAAFPP